MTFTLAVHGDPLERAHCDFITQRLPSYARLWQEFVGNDGRSQLPKLAGLSDALESQRVQINQFSYSAVESAILAKRSLDNIRGRLEDLKAGALSVDGVLDLIDRYVAFYAHMGRLHDLVEKLGVAIGDRDLGKDMKELYTRRNNVLHEARAPMLLVDETIAIVPPAGRGDNSQEWGKHRTWSQLDRMTMEDLAELLEETFGEALQLLESVFARAYAKMRSSPLSEIAEKLKKLSAPAAVDLRSVSHISASASSVPIWPSMEHFSGRSADLEEEEG